MCMSTAKTAPIAPDNPEGRCNLMSTTNARSPLDAAVEVTIAAISSGSFESDQAVQDFQKDVIDFFDAVYRQAWQNTHLAKYPHEHENEYQ